MMPLANYYFFEVNQSPYCLFDNTSISLNISNVIGMGHKIYFKSMKQSSLFLGPVYWESTQTDIQLLKLMILKIVPYDAIHQAATFEFAGLDPECELNINVNTTGQHLEDFSISSYSQLRYHFVHSDHLKSEGKALTWQQAHSVCHQKYSSNLLIYFNQREAQFLAETLLKQYLNHRPTILFTGWQAKKNVSDIIQL